MSTFNTLWADYLELMSTIWDKIYLLVLLVMVAATFLLPALLIVRCFVWLVAK